MRGGRGGAMNPNDAMFWIAIKKHNYKNNNGPKIKNNKKQNKVWADYTLSVILRP